MAASSVKYWDTDAGLTWANLTQSWTRRDYTFEALRLASRNEGASGGTDNTGDYEVPSRWDNAIVYLNVTAKSGTNPTLDVVYQTSPDYGSTWYDHTHFPQFADFTGEASIKIDNPGKYYRIEWVMGGTSTPTYTFGVEIEGKRRGGRY